MAGCLVIIGECREAPQQGGVALSRVGVVVEPSQDTETLAQAGKVAEEDIVAHLGPLLRAKLSPNNPRSAS